MVIQDFEGKTQQDEMCNTKPKKGEKHFKTVTNLNILWKM